jgi:O-phosphoseryl-tRNA(Cys) synthetase
MLIQTAFSELLKNSSMQMLYDSESCVVVHMQLDGVEQDATVKKPVLARHGFEIVDKRSGKEVYLDGSWAELFQQQITAWQANTPTQEEVEDTLDGYAELAHNPVLMH